MRFFRMLFGSFYSPDTYRRMLLHKGNGFAYSVGLTALTTACVTIAYAIMIHGVAFKPQPGSSRSIVDSMIAEMTDQVPVMTYRDGILKTQEPRAHTIRLSFDDEEEMVITIDTTGATTIDNMQTPILFTDREMIQKDAQKGKTEVRSYAENFGKGTFVINRSVVEDLAAKLRSWLHTNAALMVACMAFVAWIFFWGVMYIQRIFMLLILAVGGLVIAPCFKLKLDYSVLMRMAALSFTPVTLFATAALVLTHMSTPFLSLLLGGLVMLAAALYAVRETPLAEPA